ncbi:MAG TPA: sodium/proline symporter [Chlamydiales bacterium]|nr:sodium/proline symporter [Chlamydiales bacterium]
MQFSIVKSHSFIELATFIGYFTTILFIAFLSYKKQQSDSDFIIGNRSLNFWLTALSAHASDMSSWLFLAYPSEIFKQGVFYAWAAIGLTSFMFLNWQFIAPRIRSITEQLGSLTLNSYFETRFGDTSGAIRIVSTIMSILFYTFYITSGLTALGILVESLFGLSYLLGISVGLLIVVAYVFMGGYKTVAWIDLFQGFFLLGIIVFIPLYLLVSFGGTAPVMHAVSVKGVSTALFPDFKATTLWQILMITAGWGLGYFGQPHIITKFMGIRRVSDIGKAKWLGISWQSVALLSATWIGLIGIYMLPQESKESQQVILDIVKSSFAPFFAGLVLCAILAATTNVMAAQILVVASNMAEDLYKRLFRKEASSLELLWVTRASILLIALFGFAIASFKFTTIFQLVLYAWSGLGASFGPLLLLSLYLKNLNRYGAFSGILIGGLTAAIWPLFKEPFHMGSTVAGFILGSATILIVSYLTQPSVAAES